MPVRKRKTPTGFTEEYHYEFMQGGKRFFGVCEGCTTERAAKEYLKKIKEQAKELSEQKSAKQLVENFRDQLTGGSSILIKDGYTESLKKPRKKFPSPQRNIMKNSHWNDFVNFMETTYPDITKLSQVSKRHAEEYITHLRAQGRFNPTVVYKRGNKEVVSYSNTTLSNATLIDYQTTLSEVFNLLHDDAGIVDNPFASIPKLSRDSESREAFSEEELKIIGEKLDDFTKPLFYIATTTALREGDICTLLWNEVNFQDGLIQRGKMNKTGRPVEIPIMEPLMNYLLELRESQANRPEDEFTKYVLPNHAKMYLSNSSGVSYRIKQFLEDTCGITTTRIPSGRSRAISIKDLHSCRHTFCYYAGIYGIPLNVVQSIVGHMTPEMTKHYSAHVTREVKRQKMAQMPSFLIPTDKQSHSYTPDEMRNELKAIIERMPDQDLAALLAQLKYRYPVKTPKMLQSEQPPAEPVEVTANVITEKETAQ